jgi:hypothetical protein
VPQGQRPGGEAGLSGQSLDGQPGGPGGGRAGEHRHRVGRDGWGRWS